MNGNRKMEMTKHTQHLALLLVLVFIGAKVASPTLPTEILMWGLGGLGINLGAFVAGNVMGDHRGKKDAPPPPPAS